MITFYADQRTVAVTNGRHTRLCRAMTRVNRVFSLFSVLYRDCLQLSDYRYRYGAQ